VCVCVCVCVYHPKSDTGLRDAQELEAKLARLRHENDQLKAAAYKESPAPRRSLPIKPPPIKKPETIKFYTGVLASLDASLPLPDTSGREDVGDDENGGQVGSMSFGDMPDMSGTVAPAHTL
jgi:hypothetical protein